MGLKVCGRKTVRATLDLRFLIVWKMNVASFSPVSAVV